MADLAGQQGGYITLQQLRGVGLSEDAIKHVIARRYLIRALRGVYAFHELPPYEMNVHVLTYRVDVLFDGLIVMLDGWHVHGSRHAFEHDREEMAEIMAATGLPVLRITHRQFRSHPTRQADRIKAILARRSS